MTKEKISLKIYRSRKSCIFYYLLIFIAIVIFFFLREHKMLSYEIAIAIVIFILFILILTEILVVLNWWAITDSFLIENRGILSKKIREIDFNTISDMDISQSVFERILGYGTVNIRKFLNEKSISISNINNPDVFLNILQDAIKKNKHGKKN